MPLFYLHKDITKISADAIVNPANPTLLGGGGVDGAIHNAAGPKLLEECRNLGGCKTGQAKYTAGYELSCKYIIHTVGPVWHGGTNGERELLRECYRNCLLLAKELGCETVAFPVISAGAYGYPPTQAKEVAESEILSFLSENDMTVYLVMRDKIAAERTRLFSAIEYFMMQNGISGTDDIPAQVLENKSAGGDLASLFERAVQRATSAMKPSSSRKKDKGVTASFGECAEEKVMSLEDMLANLDESFSQTLLRLIDSSGMTDSECYKRANIDRKLFSKIRSDKNYRPSKSTVIAFAFALSLDIEDTRMLLERAGFALSRASRFDVIVEYAIKNGIYDVFEVNKVLFEYDQNLLGGVQL